MSREARPLKTEKITITTEFIDNLSAGEAWEAQGAESRCGWRSRCEEMECGRQIPSAMPRRGDAGWVDRSYFRKMDKQAHLYP